MRPFNMKLLCCIGLLMGVAMIILGCGSGGDLLDQPGYRYTAYMTLEDADEENVIEIDIYQIPDCNGDGVTDDPEPFTDVLATINIDVDEDAPGITLKGYTIEYIPLLSPDSGGVYRLGPNLIDLTDHGSFNFHIPSNGTGSFPITCMSYDTKNDLLSHMLTDADLLNLEVARYTIRITLHFEDDYLEDRDIVVDRTVDLSPYYDNC